MTGNIDRSDDVRLHLPADRRLLSGIVKDLIAVACRRKKRLGKT
jgi:hypothetical protein